MMMTGGSRIRGMICRIVDLMLRPLHKLKSVHNVRLDACEAVEAEKSADLAWRFTAMLRKFRTLEEGRERSETSYYYCFTLVSACEGALEVLLG